MFVRKSKYNELVNLNSEITELNKELSKNLSTQLDVYARYKLENQRLKAKLDKIENQESNKEKEYAEKCYELSLLALIEKDVESAIRLFEQYVKYC